MSSTDDMPPPAPAWDLEALYAVERPAMFALARLLLGSDSLAEEVIQEAFLRLHAKSGIAVSSPGGYLRTTVVNLCRDYQRRRKLEERQPAPGYRMALPAEIDEAWEAVDRLPPGQREVVVMRYYLDLAEGEIAGLLGCRVGTVKSRLHRALRQLRKELS